MAGLWRMWKLRNVLWMGLGGDVENGRMWCPSELVAIIQAFTCLPPHGQLSAKYEVITKFVAIQVFTYLPHTNSLRRNMGYFLSLLPFKLLHICPIRTAFVWVWGIFSGFVPYTLIFLHMVQAFNDLRMTILESVPYT